MPQDVIVDASGNYFVGLPLGFYSFRTPYNTITLRREDDQNVLIVIAVVAACVAFAVAIVLACWKLYGRVRTHQEVVDEIYLEEQGTKHRRVRVQNTVGAGWSIESQIGGANFAPPKPLPQVRK